MVADAQSHAADDKRRREEVEARNTADALAYQVERRLQELGPNVAVHEKARAEQFIAEIRQLVQSNSPDVARLRQLTGDLQQLAAGLESAPQNGATGRAAPQGDGNSTRGPQPGGPEDVIDADFTQR